MRYWLIGVQLCAWGGVCGLLLAKGLSHLCISSNQTTVVEQTHHYPDPLLSNLTTKSNTTVYRPRNIPPVNREGKKTPAMIMLAVAGIMLLLGPFLLVMKIIEKHKQFRKVPQTDCPPTYEEACL